MNLLFGPIHETSAKLYAVASRAGWTVFEVAWGDPEPPIAYDRHADDSGGYWFRTN